MHKKSPQDRQREVALRKANAIRRGRAKIKRDLRTGQLDPVQFILDPPPICHAVPTVDLLRWLPKIGKVKAQKLLKGKVFVTTSAIGQLSFRTRQQIASGLRPRG